MFLAGATTMPCEWARLSARLARALDDTEAAAVRRLGHARTTVSFAREGDPGDAVTLLLDRRPPAVVEGQDAEVRVGLPGAAAERFARGELVLSVALLDGDVTATGPVRRYLAVDPVLRALLQRAREAE